MILPPALLSRLTGFLLLGGSMMPTATAADAFAAARELLESRCVECHTEEKAKGGLVMTTSEAMLEGGDGGPALDSSDFSKSALLTRVQLGSDHDDRMPPAKHADPLSPKEIEILSEWLAAGAPWAEGIALAPTVASDLPPWDAAPDPRIRSIEVFPKSVTLESAADSQRVIVLARFDDESVVDVTRRARWTLSDPSLVRLAGNRLEPIADGETALQLEYRGLDANLPVKVIDALQARAVSFQLDVMPVITAAGCNTGACHGSARGQDGFGLSLFGFDPKGDHFRLTAQQPGRRINLAIPEDSLLLTKASGVVPHTGGKLFEPTSDFYRTLLTWIRDGAGYDVGEIAEPLGIEFEPSEVVISGAEVPLPLIVRARYSDGTDRDVTALSTFSSSNDNAVEVDSKAARVLSKSRGEALLLARFHTFAEGAQAIVVPADGDFVKRDFPAINEIDSLVAVKHQKLRIHAAPLADDETFLRRVFIDVIGLLPTSEERAAFLADTRPEKRALLIDALLERPEFTELWVMKWAELLQIRTFNDGPKQVSYKAALNYYNWLRERIAGNQPFNETVHDILAAQGGTFSSPATNFYQVEQDTLKLTENVAQVFMGTRLQCTQCHNHPFDRWTMNDYYGFASFFSQVRRKPAEDPRERVIFDGGGKIENPVTQAEVMPKFLGGATPDLNGETRREVLADWLTAPDNPWFAKNIANIVWAHFFGVGIVEPVDDMRVSNPPSNPALFDYLGNRFVAVHFDVRQLVREICNSRTYQLSSQTDATNAGDSRNFSHAMVRRMRAEVLLDAISQATATPNKFKGLPSGARAVQIADGNTTNFFLTTFGRATRATVCSCEVVMEPNLSQALHLINGDNTGNRIRQGALVETWLKEGTAPEEIVSRLYLRTLQRPPGQSELEKLLPAIAATEGQPEEPLRILEDVFWALLNSKEFIFSH